MVPSAAKKARLSWGVPFYLPPREDGETNDSIQIFKEKMMKESKKVPHQQNTVQCQLAMVKTFPDRRSFIVRDPKYVAEVLLEYPLLRSKNEILNEFSRLVGGWSIISRMATLKDIPVDLIQSKSDKHFLDSVKMRISGSRTDESKIYLTNCYKILRIPFLLNECPSSFLKSVDESHPRIIPTFVAFDEKDLGTLLDGDSFDVKVEEEILATTNNFFDAVCLMLASYYVFNIVYPNSLINTLTFIQKYILDIGDETKTLGRVSTFISRIKKAGGV
ncbi:uncharacterized protein [Clytia hemisphaerica]